MRFSLTTQSFYPDNVEYTDLPTDLVEVSDAEYTLAVHRLPGATLSLSNGEIVINPPVADLSFQSTATLIQPASK